MAPPGSRTSLSTRALWSSTVLCGALTQALLFLPALSRAAPGPVGRDFLAGSGRDPLLCTSWKGRKPFQKPPRHHPLGFH